MWEAIRSNQRRSLLLIALMGVLLVALGGVIGAAVVPPVDTHFVSHGRGPQIDPLLSGAYGAGVALLIWLILWAVAAGSGDGILLSAAGAKRIEKEQAPQLWNVVEEMSIASGLGQMPSIYVIDDDAPNAFAVGYRPGRAAVAVTAGLLRRLNRDELQGVIAHEIGHIRNLDVRFMTMAGVMVGSIVIISDIFLRSLWYGGGRRSSRSSRGGGQAQAILMLIAILLAILAPLLAQMLYFACSRKREYLADASSARFTRYPEGLASALEKISRQAGRNVDDKKKANRVVAPMYIINPLQAQSAVGLMSTHPPTEKRVKVLRGMGGNVGFVEYESAFRKIHGDKASCIGARTLGADTGAEVRAPSVEPGARQDAVARARAAGDLMAGLADYLFIACACGVRIKVPPEFKRPSITCPRCGRQHEIPVAAATAAMAVGAALKGADQTRPATMPKRPPMRYVRKGTGWESFRCGSCGHTVQISPAFSATNVRCPKCNATIQVDHAR